jgi:hypothetical protein
MNFDYRKLGRDHVEAKTHEPVSAEVLCGHFMLMEDVPDVDQTQMYQGIDHFRVSI